MSTISQATPARLLEFASVLQENIQLFRTVKEDMSHHLNSIRFNDVQGTKFKAQYEESLAPIENNLIPTMEAYIQYLNKQASLLEQFMMD